MGASVGGLLGAGLPPPSPPAFQDPYPVGSPPPYPYQYPSVDVSKSSPVTTDPLDAGIPAGATALVQIEAKIQATTLLSSEQKKELISKLENLSVRELYHLVEQFDFETDKQLKAGQRFQSLADKLGTPSSEAALQKLTLPIAEPVAGRSGYFLDPYTNQPLDARGHASGAVMMNPETGRRFRLP